MPYRRKPSRKRAKRRTASKRSVKPIIPLSYGFPDTYKTKLRYAGTYERTFDGVTGLNQYVWNLNSLYDPDQTGTGAQPTYFDQLTAVYAKYRVYGCMIEVTVFNRQPSDPLYMSTITRSDNSGTSEDPVSISLNTNGSKLKMISSEGSDNMYTYRKYYPINEVFGVNKSAIMSSPEYVGLTGGTGFGTNPAQVAQFVLDASGQPSGLARYSMVMTFYCQFEAPKNVLQS